MPTPATQAGAATAASPRAVVDAVHRLAMDYDLAGQAELYAPDGVLEWPFAPSGMPRRVEGREEIRRVLGALGDRVRQAGRQLTGINSKVLHETLDPEVVIVELEVHGEVPATGALFQLPYIQVFRVRDGQIVSFRDYFSAGTAAVTAAADPAQTPTDTTSPPPRPA